MRFFLGSFLLFLFISQTPADELEDTVLYGEDSIDLRAETSVSGGNLFSGGDLQVGIGGEITGDVYVYETLTLSDASLITGDVFVGIEAILNGSASITGDLTEGVVDFPEVSIPSYESVPGARNFTIRASQTRILREGSFNNISVADGATLILAGGTYQINRLILSSTSTVVVNAPSILISALAFNWGAEDVQFTGTASAAYDFILYTPSASTSTIQRDAYFEGILYAPEGPLRVATGAYAKGVFKALSILVYPTALVEWSSEEPPCVPEVEICDDGVDQDCDEVDQVCADLDADGDGFTTNTGDCDDARSDVNPLASELCDGIDNNCDGLIDDATALDTSLWYPDTDGDGFGLAGSPQVACSQPAGYVSSSTDCDDTHAEANPAGVEVCDALDNDCDGEIDDDEEVPDCEDGITLPSNPEDIATEVDSTTAGSSTASTAFLYEGEGATQTGVAEGTIDISEAAVIRGQVFDSSSNSLAGVTINILDHTEFGSTLTREDGSFDFVLNGGGVFTVNFEKDGYFSVQRQVYAPWQDYVWVQDVVLLVADSVVTSIDLSVMTEMEVAQGSSVTDDSGTRQATLLVPQGITAQMELPDGTTQSTSTLNIRATEYTSGATGESAMPGNLPPTSAFTYAVEFSIDEATEVDATNVTFSEPLIFHLDNFLNFPVGEAVPLGYYDKEAGAWIPSENGIVIEILSITDGLADLDLDGSGVAADAAALSELGVTDAEREKLGSLYIAGTSLWRVKIPHLTPWDCNWPFGSPDDAVAPTLASLPPGAPIDDPSCQGGSIIECENQTLGEMISIVGTSYALVYRSDRVPGRGAGYTVEIPLSGDSISTSLKRIEVEIYAAGLKETASVDATTNATYTYTWDGIDAYGRALQGGQKLTVRVGYVYDQVYVSAADAFEMSFANFGDTTEIIGDRTRREITFWQKQTRTIGGFNAASLKMGGWSISPHHFYDPTSRTLYLGDGRRRQVDEVEKIITTIAGDGTCVSGDAVGDGEDATDSVLCKPIGLAADAEGNIYVSNDYNHRIRKISTEGIITTIAGTGVRGSTGDGGPATSAKLNEAKGLSVDTDGNLYFADYGNHKVRKVDAGGTITTIAGTGTAGFSGDGGEAASAQLYHPVDTTLDDQGNLYILDAGNYRIRKVTLDGSITTIAGNGDNNDNGDNNPAINAELCYYVTTTGYAGIDVDYQGNIYYADGVCDKVRKITPDGIITTIVGGDNYATEVGDGGPATEANIDGTYDVVVDDVGNLYVIDGDNNRIRKVTPDGVITTVAGNGERGFAGDDGLATDAEIYSPYAMALDPRGNLYVPSYSYHRIRKIYSPFEKYSGDHIIISSEDGTEIYEFNETGRHLNTLHPLTGQTLLSFTYNESGFLTSITDGDGNVVTLNRDGNNNLTSIVAPHGQETIVALDANGYLNSVENPEAETYTLLHDATGLLTEFTTPENNTTTFDYDDLGYLILDLDSLGGSKSLFRSGADDNFTVTLTTSLGLETIYSVEVGTDKSTTRTIINPSGLVTETVIATNGTKAITYPNGVTQTVEDGPDPRFGMQAPVLESNTISTPASLVFTMETERSISLTDPDDYLSLSFQTDTTIINGRSYTQSFDASNDQLTTTSPEGRQVVSDIDDQGRITNLDVAGLDAISFSYDASGRLDIIEEASDGSRTYNLDYDTNGFLDTITDPLSRQTTFDYDAAGRVVTQTLPDARQITYTYDANGNLETITPPGKPAHSFGYNELDYQEDYIPPPLGGGAGGGALHYDYNLDHQLDLVTRPDGTTIDLEYDTGGRLATVATSAGTTFYDYNITTGQLDTITTPTSETLTYAFDGFLPTITTWSGTISGSITKAYDDNFWITNLSYMDPPVCKRKVFE
ncbi:MAG: hypothetical protein A3G32_06135 [Deltaproteobacteria bacterium RIFCSPLOWO2_12_FULL_40_28]|nr:MAG: hypothetical protein A3C45_08135 [Deltaproteobacteria bacterium RIFCSPHIGHO2_02_FULL_40_28]OGQ54773.1 MAG: hypothetical protein A3G32_06135 [Deltaproteobacteria bacterium RIFCSPLOWO2_12_FULL_40_28]